MIGGIILESAFRVVHFSTILDSVLCKYVGETGNLSSEETSEEYMVVVFRFLLANRTDAMPLPLL